MISSKTRSNCAGSFSAILIAKSRSSRVNSRSFDRLQRRSISCAVVVSINRVLLPLKTGPSGDKAILALAPAVPLCVIDELHPCWRKKFSDSFFQKLLRRFGGFRKYYLHLSTFRFAQFRIPVPLPCLQLWMIFVILRFIALGLDKKGIIGNTTRLSIQW